MHYKDIEMLGFDVGRFLFALYPDMQFNYSSMVDKALKFTGTFSTSINTDNQEQREQFFYNVGRGIEFAKSE